MTKPELGAEPQKKNLKVARVIARLNVGGPAIHACFLHRALRPQFQTLLLVGQLDEGEADMSYLLPSSDGVCTIETLYRPVRLWADLRSIFRLTHLFLKEKPDIVHTHTAKAGTVGRIAAVLARVPIIIHTYHGHIFKGGYFSARATRLFLAIERALGRFTDTIVTVSESQARELSAEFHVAPREKIRVIANGYNLQPFLKSDGREELRREWGIAPDDCLVVWAGRFVPVKGIELLAELAQLARPHRRLRFVVVGDGTERDKLVSLLDGCENVQLVGWRRDMPQVWAAADVALVTSRNEGTPSALVEAMAAARPFVSTAAGGVVDMVLGTARDVGPGVQEFANGFITESRGAAMLRALLVLHADPAKSVAMGRTGSDFAQREFSQERLAHAMTDLYLSLAGHHEQ